MDHSRSRTLIRKKELKKDISMPVAIEKDLMRQAKHGLMVKIEHMVPGKYSDAELNKKTYSRLEEIYEKELKNYH